MDILTQLGYNSERIDQAKAFDANLLKGRISVQHKGMYRAITENGEYLVQLSGKDKFTSYDLIQTPAVGDFVLIKPFPNEHKGIIQHVLPRTQQYIRNAAGNQTKPQLIATNIDYAFLTMSCNDNFNTNRLERYLIATYDSGATPIIVMTKSDLITELEKEIMIAELSNVAPTVPVYFVQHDSDDNIETLKNYLKDHKTGTLLGSSGVGKSTLINRLLGKDVMDTGEIRLTDDKGKHTTTHRELLLLDGGGILIDTPGMREFQLWSTGENLGLITEFEDVENIIVQCKFNDCTHTNEPGCAINAAIETGELSEDRFERYNKYLRELEFVERRNDEAKMSAERNKWKKLTKIGKANRNAKIRKRK
ncbi:ribosome small subunit-dependent GTPase A [Macrococcus capreoli]|uniref:ribosome small subunit-dependent GTPase A n=1 Tax=Macrococcus capreoli TaxID=2982690 RepID=UPI0021D6053B|nr:ribosome small subunit-dependent GTPase A [Macrococcus sp. TMW 2.2395]MCU7556222.1 ribosome small subunit-dependent GTPase A [Macrococcus sp. TMW 2.2395]